MACGSVAAGADETGNTFAAFSAISRSSTGGRLAAQWELTTARQPARVLITRISSAPAETLHQTAAPKPLGDA
ncbi:hypothetical protein GCM10017687_12730 [Streptomyces echinatus]